AGSGVGWALGTSFRGMTGCKGMKGYHVDTKDRIDGPLQKQRPLVEGTFRRRVRQARAGGRPAFAGGVQAGGTAGARSTAQAWDDRGGSRCRARWLVAARQAETRRQR